MSSVADDVMAQALQLSEEKRGELADRLIESLHRPPDGSTPEEIKAAWTAECRRRMAASDAGEPGIPLEEAWPRIAGRHA